MPDVIQLSGETPAPQVPTDKSVDWRHEVSIYRHKDVPAFPGERVRDLHFMPFYTPRHHVTTRFNNVFSAAMLISHYAENVAHLTQPVVHQSNPFRSLYLPLAIKGSLDMEDYQALGGNISARAAVFHSLVATAALHLLGLGFQSQELEHLVCHHKQQALLALRCALSRKVGTYKELMMVVLSLVSVDVSLVCLGIS
jgi:hypothetical protein